MEGLVEYSQSNTHHDVVQVKNELYIVKVLQAFKGLVEQLNLTVKQNMKAKNLAQISVSESKPLTIAYITSKKRYHFMMDRWWFQIWEALQRKGNVNSLPIWGPGFDGYNKTLSLEDNLKRYFPDEKIDVVLLEKQDFNHFRNLMDPFVQNVAVSCIYHESSSSEGGGKILWNLPELSRLKTDVIFFAYASEMALYANFSVHRLLAHLPHGSPNELFFKPVENRRDVKVMVSGSLVASFYPLRLRVANLIRNGKLPGLVRPHPGYSELWDEEKLQNQSKSLEQSLAQIKEYAEQLGNSQIVICTSSTRGYSLRKYVEAAMAGALVIGNIPLSDRSEEFQKYVVEIHGNMTDDQIIEIIQWWLEHPAERLARAKIGQEIALEKYTWNKLTDQMVKIFLAHKEGQRGMMFPYAFNTQFQRIYGPKYVNE